MVSNVYYCQMCRQLHNSGEKLIFKTGFVYIETKRYPIGLCKHASSHDNQPPWLTSSLLQS